MTGDYHSTSEIFDLEMETLSAGPDLPGGSYWYGSQAVSYMDTILLMGGKQEGDLSHQEGIHQLDLETMEWIERPERMKLGRVDHVAFEIPLGSCL